VDKYTWVDRGSSYLLGEIPAALLFANLSARKTVQSVRLRAWNYYHRELQSWASRQGVGLPGLVAGGEHPAHLYYLIMPDNQARQSLAAHMKARGVSVAYHYQPLHLSPMGLKYGGRQGQCPVAERMAECLLRLPVHASLSVADLEQVVGAVLEWTS
jgi:dTDP-4-amino-4,6-dideoxygalactose transaminase